MGLYNVVKPCVVAKRHHVRPTTTAPIEVEDEVAAPLIESGCLEPYRPGAKVSRHPLGWSPFASDAADRLARNHEAVEAVAKAESEIDTSVEVEPQSAEDKAPTDPPPPRRSRGRRRNEG